MWNIISSICLILPKSLTYLFIVVIYKYHWWDNIYGKWNKRFIGLSLLLLLLLSHWTTTLMRTCVTYLTLKFCVTMMTILLYTTMLISNICLGTTLIIELNGLKMTQLFGTFWLILGIQNDTWKYFDTWLYIVFVMMLDADNWYCTGNSITRRSHTGILIYIKNTLMTCNIVWQQLRLIFWFGICRVYLLVLWYEWWTRIYNCPYGTDISIRTCEWILWISYQQY